jgi:hypothetical protein
VFSSQIDSDVPHSWVEMLNPCSETQCMYPLCLPRSGVEADDLHRYHRDLNSRTNDLFIADEKLCHVELREYIHRGLSPTNGTGTASTTGEGSPVQQSKGRTSEVNLCTPSLVTSMKILRSIVKVIASSIVDSKGALANSSARKRYRRAVLGYCKSYSTRSILL